MIMSPSRVPLVADGLARAQALAKPGGVEISWLRIRENGPAGPGRMPGYGETAMFQRAPKRLDEEGMVCAAIAALFEEGYDRATIELALIRQAPVDLDLLAQCYERLFAGQAAQEHQHRAA